MFACGLARCRTGCGNCGIGHLGVTKCGSFVRRVSIATMAGVGGVTLFGAGGGGDNRFVIVTRCGNSFLCDKNFVTYRAMRACGLARCRTGCGNCGIGHLGVSERGSFVCGIGIATVASVSGVTLCSTGGHGDNCFVIVSRCGNGFLCDEGLSTARAFFTLGKSRCGTGRSNGVQYRFGVMAVIVRQLSNDVGLKVITVFAIAAFFALCGFGRILGYNPIAIAVSGCGDGFLRNKNHVTY